MHCVQVMERVRHDVSFKTDDVLAAPQSLEALLQTPKLENLRFSGLDPFVSSEVLKRPLAFVYF